MRVVAINGSPRKGWNTDTLQIKDCSRYRLAGSDAAAKQLRHETAVPQDCRKAFEPGAGLAAGADR